MGICFPAQLAWLCFDMDFPSIIKGDGRNSTGNLLAPSFNFAAVEVAMHTHMAIFRTIENGISMVRQADNGLSMASDPYGRVLAQAKVSTNRIRRAGGEKRIIILSIIEGEK